MEHIYPKDEYKEQSSAYTTNVLRKRPSPSPTTHLPKMNIPRLTAPASNAAPTAYKKAPIEMALGRPRLSESDPATSDAGVAVKSTEETMKPRRDDETSPKPLLKVDIEVTGPMVPVSRL